MNRFINTAEWLETIRNAEDQIRAIQAILKANPTIGNEDVFQSIYDTIKGWPKTENAAAMIFLSLMNIERSFNTFKTRPGLEAQSALASLLTDVRLLVFWVETWRAETGKDPL